MLALITAGSAACGVAQATPAGKVQNAFTKLSDQKSLTLGVSFGGSADQIYTYFKGEDDFTRADAQLLANLRATYAFSSDQPIGHLKSGDKSATFGFAVSDDAAAKQQLIEVRSIGGKLYLRADLKAVSKLASSADSGSGDSGDSLGLNELLDEGDQLPASMGAFKAALKGDWISIDPTAFESLAKTFGADAGLPTSNPQLDAKTQTQVLTGLRNAVAHNAKFKDLGNRDGADHIQLTVPARPFAKELTTSLAPVLKKVPGYKQSDVDKGLKDVPNRTVSADLAIKDGTISAVTVDLAQLDDQPHTGQLPLTLSLAGGTAAVAVPSGAVELKPKDLLGLITADMPKLGSADSSSGSGTDSSGSGGDSSSSSSAAPSLTDLQKSLKTQKQFVPSGQ
ncbi:hypothetical protein ACFO3J_16575 [Streptomyces polygonati]|uniref:Secreted protein n=1 Tax=Streptomyces polygonati TaxID=1617087 RepID=A0ABV8HM35_9ACTN